MLLSTINGMGIFLKRVLLFIIYSIDCFFYWVMCSTIHILSGHIQCIAVNKTISTVFKLGRKLNRLFATTLVN